MISMPTAMNTSPGIIRNSTDIGFFIIPLQVSAIGHIGKGLGQLSLSGAMIELARSLNLSAINATK